VILFFVLIVILLIGLTTAAVLGKIGGFMADPTSSQSFGGVPDGPLSTRDLVELHFDQALRGYRMDQVDEVIDALNTRLRELESELASLPAPDEASTASAGPEDVSRESGDLGDGTEHPGDGTTKLSGDTQSFSSDPREQ
jgi:DivIVA domain-containing protein